MDVVFPDYTEEDFSRAHKLAKKAHRGQTRKKKGAFFNHPKRVAGLIEKYGGNIRSRIIGIMHDTVEDTSVTLEDIEREFDSVISRGVDGVTKINDPSMTAYEREQKTREKVAMYAGIDSCIALVKGVDRRDNNMDPIDEEGWRAKSLSATLFYAELCRKHGYEKLALDLKESVGSFEKKKSGLWIPVEQTLVGGLV